jgi:hypothetical protein
MRTSLIVSSLAILGVVGFAAAPEETTAPSKTSGTPAVGSVQTYDATTANQQFRVTLLGVTKGVAFLNSQELAADGGRKHGNNVIPWLRIAVLVERLSDNAEPLGAIGFEIRTPDGQRLVDTLHVQLPGTGTTVISRESGVALNDLPDSARRLALQLFPTASPKVENPDRSKVLFLTVSGNIRDDSRRAELLLKFGEDEFVFKDVPLP